MLTQCHTVMYLAEACATKRVFREHRNDAFLGGVTFLFLYKETIILPNPRAESLLCVFYRVLVSNSQLPAVARHSQQNNLQLDLICPAMF